VNDVIYELLTTTKDNLIRSRRST